MLSKTVGSAFNLKPVTGAIGIEIEVEGVSLPIEVAGWRRDKDGSLRGPETGEYVLEKPVSYEAAIKKVQELYQAFTVQGTTVMESMRAGVHVHYNMQNLTFQELFTVLAAYYCLEVPITERLGEDRVGNLFCLRMVDADYISILLTNALKNNGKNLHAALRGDSIKYAALNLECLTRYGSIEFRAMQTKKTSDELISWLTLIHNLVTNTIKNFRSPEEVLNFFSANGEEQATKAILGDSAGWVLEVPHYQDKIFSGLRATQLWVYSSEWVK